MTVTFAPVRMVEIPAHLAEPGDTPGLLVPYVGEQHPLAVNVNGTNFVSLALRLDLPLDPNDGPPEGISAADFLGRVLVAGVGFDDSGVAGATDGNFTDTGRRPGYFADVLGRLADLAIEVADGRIGWVG